MPFDDLFGNQRVKKVFKSYLANHMTPYSMIFAGTGSVNLEGFALALAKALNCLQEEADFCDECVNCSEINRDIFPDVRRMEPEGQFYRKEQVDFLKEDNVRRPLRGKRKVYVMRDAHRLTESAANAFLKVLEEPASGTMFILLTPNISGLLPTIKSRCQIVRFSPPGTVEIQTYLQNGGMPEKQAILMSRLAQSQRIDLLNMETGALLETRESVLNVLEKLICRKGIEEVMLDLTAISRKRDVFIAYFRELVNLISVMLRDIIVIKVTGENDVLLNIDYQEKLAELGGCVSVEKLLELMKKMELLLRDIQRNLNAKVLVQEFILSYT